MKVKIVSILDIEKYNPYVELNEFRNDEYFEGKLLEYFEAFKTEIERLKDNLEHKSDKQIDKLFNSIVKQRNDEELARIFDNYLVSVDKRKLGNEDAIVNLKNDVRTIKDIILAVENADMKRLLKIDDKMGKLIDSVSYSLEIDKGMLPFAMPIKTLLHNFKPVSDANIFAPSDRESFLEFSRYVKSTAEELRNFYRKNFSVKSATDYIETLNFRVDELIEQTAKSNKFNIVKLDEEDIDILVFKYDSIFDVDDITYFDNFKKDIECLRKQYIEKYSNKLAKKLIKLLDNKTGEVIDRKAKLVGYPQRHEEQLKEIFDSYKPEKIDIHDMMFYSSEEERDAQMRYLSSMCSEEEKSAFEMRIYDQYVRMFKGKIRELNKDIRKVYSLKYANKMIAQFNKRADKLVCDKAKEIGKPVPKNPWFARKYLWADTENFISEDGLKFRKIINPLMRSAVKLFMNNKLIIEEREKLDPTKQYIFVPTHYFTEDAIGMFASLDRQASMLMGTTDQIENNPLMLAAVFFGFFHVDRMDYTNRRECVEKQNRIIDYGANFINYVSGSWENSENELQPLSFSGPYRTSNQKNVEIVPVGLYLVREEKKIYVRYGTPLDFSNVDEKTANEIIRDTLASMHFKQMHKHSVPIDTIEVEEYGKTHNLPYDQHTYYMEQVANEYWNQPWSKPFAVEEIGIRPKKVTTEEDVYAFVDDLSREKLIELSKTLAEPLLRRDEKQRYDMIQYIDNNFNRLKNNNVKRKVRDKKEK